MERSTGLVLVAVGGGIVVLGLLALTGSLGWFGRLPGDIRIDGERSRVFIPVTSMLVVSVGLTIVLNLLGRWLR
jgi:hypothetical protein